MRKRNSLLIGLVCAVAAGFAVGVRGEAAGEIARLAELSEEGMKAKEPV